MDTMEKKIALFFGANPRTVLTKRALARRLRINKRRMGSLGDALDSLVEQLVLLQEDGEYQSAAGLELRPARLVRLADKFGFARPMDDGDVADVFIPGRRLLGAMPGDELIISVKTASDGRFEGRVRRITSEINRITGTVQRDNGDSWLIPDVSPGLRMRLSGARSAVAENGDKVLAEIYRRGKHHMDHRVKILESFGSADSAAACCEAILAANGIYRDFPEAVAEQAHALEAAGIHPRELDGREDLRDEPIFTIDSEHSKDLDDAIGIAKTADGWALGVHIADVSHYIRAGSPLDEEALLRGSSTYFADSVVPMLPPEISNGICSLTPAEDRLCLSAMITLDAEGKMTACRFAKTVIRSVVKGVYNEINAILSGETSDELATKYAAVIDKIPLMRELAGILHERRIARGSLLLESSEGQIIVGADGRAIDIQPRQSGESENIIEEFMLCANEATASLAIRRRLPFVYRVHEKPNLDKLAMLYEVLDKLGVKYRHSKDVPTPAQLSKILAKVRGESYGGAVNYLMLRSMAKAKYSAENLGHYGLALKRYAHFTAPIRRYSDLAAHRILSAHLGGMKYDKLKARFEIFAAEAARQSTMREGAVMTAERDCEDRYKAEYMSGKLGQRFSGMISSVTGFGVFVKLPNTVEGLLPLRALGDGETATGRWEFDGIMQLSDKLTGRTLKLGDPLEITVAAADISAGKIDFSL